SRGRQFAPLVGAGRVGVPGDIPRQLLRVVAERPLPHIVLPGQPEDAVAVERSPEGRERIAKAEVESSHLAPAGRCGTGNHTTAEVGIDESFKRFEGAAIFLSEPRLAEAA